MVKIVMFLALFFFSGNLMSQTMYAVTSQNKIYRIEPDFTPTYLTTASPVPSEIGDIAIDPSGVLYAVAHAGIYRVDMSTGNATLLNSFPNVVMCPALVCSNDYKLYTINLGPTHYLFCYDILTNTVSQVVDIGYETSGDLTFYKGNLIFQSFSVAEGYSVKAYNLQTGVLSDILCLPNIPVYAFYGLTNKYEDCGNETIYGFRSYSGLYHIDLEAQTYSQIPISFPDGPNVNGLASTNEHLGSLCMPQSLSDLDCALSNESFSSVQPVIYPNPANDILHLENINDAKIIHIYTSTGKLIRTFANPSESIDISGLSNGIYLLDIQFEEKTILKKFSKI